MKCPFCNEDDFDAIGLKVHLLRNQCEVLPHVLSPEEERQQKRAEAMHASGRTASGNDIGGI
jgi:hypothetical protein